MPINKEKNNLKKIIRPIENLPIGRLQSDFIQLSLGSHNV